MNRPLAVGSILAFIVILLVPSPIMGYLGGAGSGDRQYDCGGSCHYSTSTATITMSSTALVVNPGDHINVTVEVVGGQQILGNPLGVMLVSSLTTSSGLPSEHGWTIIKDPGNVTAYNYYEIASYEGSCSIVWEISAPSTVGIYTLYARVMHGGGDAYAADNVAGLIFQVTTEPIPEFPVLIVPFLAVTLVIIIFLNRRGR